jgi:HK97 gp10 family phage protein
MADSVQVKVDVTELRRRLAELPAKLRRKVLVKALKAGARHVQRAARAAAPVLATPQPYRTKGLLRRRITVRTSKAAKERGDVGVFVNVRPAKAGERGANSKLDPFYWRFVAFGTKAHTIKPKTAKALAFGGRVVKMVKHPGTAPKNFLDAGADALPQALAAFERDAVPAIEALNHRGS